MSTTDVSSETLTEAPRLAGEVTLQEHPNFA
jgi:hypothetical protein